MKRAKQIEDPKAKNKKILELNNSHCPCDTMIKKRTIAIGKILS